MVNLGSVNEKTTASIILKFKDELDNPVTPTGLTYQINTTAGTIVRASTVVTPTTNSYTLNLSIGDNTLIDTTTTDETHIITITWTYGTNKQGTEEYRYVIKNLQYIT